MSARYKQSRRSILHGGTSDILDAIKPKHELSLADATLERHVRLDFSGPML